MYNTIYYSITIWLLNIAIENPLSRNDLIIYRNIAYRFKVNNANNAIITFLKIKHYLLIL